MPDIVLIGAMSPRMTEGVAKRFPFHRIASEDALNVMPADIRQQASVVIAANKIGARTPAALPKLRFVLNLGIGYDQLDLTALKSAGIAAANLAGLADECVADMAMALLLAHGRHIVQGDRFVRSGAWLKGGYPLVPRVWGKRMGILGLGRIGLAIAKRAAAFDMRVAYHNRRPRTDVPYWYYPKLVDMARDVDILMVATPGGEGTLHIVTAEVIKALGPKGLIVNIARGSIIDELAMVKALKDGTLGGAALDVFEFEPKMPEELHKMDNVVLMPHRGGGTYETWEDACDMVRDNIFAYLKTGKPLTPIAETPID